MAIYLNH